MRKHKTRVPLVSGNKEVCNAAKAGLRALIGSNNNAKASCLMANVIYGQEVDWLLFSECYPFSCMKSVGRARARRVTNFVDRFGAYLTTLPGFAPNRVSILHLNIETIL
jgi:hypothetical protein